MARVGKRKRGSDYAGRFTKRRKYTPARYRRRKQRIAKKKSGYFNTTMTVRPTRKSFQTPGKVVVKGTSHRSEYKGNGYSSTTLGAQYFQITLNNIFLNSFFVGPWATQQRLTGFDAYGADYPTNHRKVFLKGVKLNFRITNFNENNITVRMCLAKPKNNKNATDWNTDPHRVINSRHWKIMHYDKFTMDQGEFTAVQTSGTTTGVQSNANTMVTREYYFPLNQWLYTSNGDPASAGSDFDIVNNRDELVFFIDHDDVTSIDGQYVQFTVNATLFWQSISREDT